MSHIRLEQHSKRLEALEKELHNLRKLVLSLMEECSTSDNITPPTTTLPNPNVPKSKKPQPIMEIWTCDPLTYNSLDTIQVKPPTREP